MIPVWLHGHADNIVYMDKDHYGTNLTKSFNEKVLSAPEAGFQTEAKALMIITDEEYNSSLMIVRNNINKQYGIEKIAAYKNNGQAWWEDEDVLVWKNNKPVTYVDIREEDIKVIRRISLKNYKSTVITTKPYNKINNKNYSVMKITIIDGGDIFKDLISTIIIVTRSDIVEDYGIGHDFKIRSLPNINSLVTDTEIKAISDIFIDSKIKFVMYPMFYLTIENETKSLISAYKLLTK